MKYDFEELVAHSLNIVQARDMLRHKGSTMLAYVTGGGPEPRKASLLGFTDVAEPSNQSLLSVEFSTRSSRYIRESIAFAHVLHYDSIDLDRIKEDAALPRDTRTPNPHAELWIVYEKERNPVQTNDIGRTALHCRYFYAAI